MPVIFKLLCIRCNSFKQAKRFPSYIPVTSFFNFLRTSSAFSQPMMLAFLSVIIISSFLSFFYLPAQAEPTAPQLARRGSPLPRPEQKLPTITITSLRTLHRQQLSQNDRLVGPPQPTGLEPSSQHHEKALLEEAMILHSDLGGTVIAMVSPSVEAF